MELQSTTMRPALRDDCERIAEIATQAWTPIFALWLEMQGQAFGQVLEERRAEHTGAAVRSFCEANPDSVWVTEWHGEVVGFITFLIDRERGRGTISWNAVAPEHTGKGIGTKQIETVLDVFRQLNLRYADVTTNHDDGHASARRMYEKAGFVPVFISLRYMRPL